MQCDKYLGLAMAMRTNDKKSTDRLEKKIDDLKIGRRCLMSDISYPLPCINCASRLQSEYACNNCIHNGAKSDDKFDNFIPLKDVAPSVNEKSVNDNVNHPSHYETGSFECIDVMLETQGKEAVKNFCLCNAFKYIYRHNNKNGLEDIQKAKWYIDKYIELSE